MHTIQNSTYSFKDSIKAKANDYAQLLKLRLTSLVIFSTFIGYVVGSSSNTNWWLLVPLLVGGFLTVASANSLNQVIERKTDRLMKRTLNRPLATNRMSVFEAVIISLILGLVGVILLGYYLNTLSAILAFTGLIVYAFLYTPLKKISSISVWVGAIAGAIPPVIGLAAATGEINSLAWSLFVLQFIWQFPHFYAIAWLLDDDYKRAGLKLMPIGGEKDKVSTYQITVLTALFIPASIIPFMLGTISILGFITILSLGIYMTWKAIKLHQTPSDVTAKKLMFSSFMYLPLALIGITIDYFIK